MGSSEDAIWRDEAKHIVIAGPLEAVKTPRPESPGSRAIEIKPPYPEDVHGLGICGGYTRACAASVYMEDAKHTGIEEWMVAALGRKHHDIRVCPRVDRILRAAHVVRCPIDAHHLVHVYTVAAEMHGSDICQGRLGEVLIHVSSWEAAENMGLQLVYEILQATYILDTPACMLTCTDLACGIVCVVRSELVELDPGPLILGYMEMSTGRGLREGLVDLKPQLHPFPIATRNLAFLEVSRGPKLP